MTVPRELGRKVEEDKKESKSGSKIVVFGAIASILLWLIVLAKGNPIVPFTTATGSFLYAIGVTLPALVISLIALLKLGRRKAF
jgi:membrane-bound metal-dependent hydrolase YbcI (DUF457 family)